MKYVLMTGYYNLGTMTVTSGEDWNETITQALNDGWKLEGPAFGYGRASFAQALTLDTDE